MNIYSFKNRRNPIGRRVEFTWSELVEKLRIPEITNEFMAEYAAMSNEDRTEIKDVGGYIAGELEGGRRSKATVKNRCIVTIDADDARMSDWKTFVLANPGMQVCCHSTHSSTPEQPRLRWLFPLSRPVTGEEYKLIARELCALVGADTIDESTDQPERLMFWPSVSLDADYLFYSQEGEPFDVDDYLVLFGDDLPVPEPTKSAPVSDGELVIGEGQRNKTVFGFAASLRGQGLSSVGIREMLDTYNNLYCEPPLASTELDTITRSVCTRYAAGDPVAASLRDAWDDFHDLGEWKETEPKVPDHLVYESIASLHSRNVAPPTYVVPGMIPTGITILASPPKFGKSWMCLDLAISVSTGTEFMGQQTNKHGVIYLALEDGDFRLKERSAKVSGGRELSENLWLIKDAPTLADGLLQQLKMLMADTSANVGMIIIDTLQKIRGVAGKTEGVYGYDYRELGLLHKFALDNNIAIVLVHHLNKSGDDSDPVNRLNGSTGVSGAADAIITLSRTKRKDKETLMTITGRDVKERELIIQMDWGRYRWMILGEADEVESKHDELDFYNDVLVKTILYHMEEEAEELAGESEDAVWECTSSELLDECERLYGKQSDVNAQTIGHWVNRLDDKLSAYEGVSHAKFRSNSRKIHRFTRPID
jgi:hypothetical protein